MKIFALINIILVLLAGAAFGQEDPFGQVDTVYIDPVTVRSGSEFSVVVNLFNDESLGGVTIPLNYPVDKMDFIEIDFTGGRIEYLNTKPTAIDTVNGTVLAGAIVFFETNIRPGVGKLFSIKFRLKEGLTPGDVFYIDSTTIFPAELVLTASNAANIFPVFKKGRVTVGSENRAPYLTPIPELYIAEGDSLRVDIEAIDPDGDALILANPIHPYSSEFTDNGDGTGQFVWGPDFIGPLSADMSPFTLIFWVSDGEASSYNKVKVNVINVNRGPSITAPENILAEAGDSLGIAVVARDPDFENIEWSVSGLPSGANFDFENPGLISWASDYADSGLFAITLIATDPYGLADTAVINIELLPVTLFAIRIDTVSSFSGRTVDLNIYLKNKPEIAEINLLLRIDPAVLIPIGVSRAGSRIEEFQYFNYRINENGIPGNLRITARADGASPLGQGDGLLFTISILISSDLSYVGNQVPIVFESLFAADNTLILSDGSIIYPNEINLFAGHILIIAPGDRLLGDINLNGIAFEISDAVYFSNAFISPNLYPLNEQQILNSDINQDGFAPSVADMVMMVKVITGEINQPPGKILPGTLAPVELFLSREDDGLYLVSDAPVEMGGAFFRITGEDAHLLNPSNLTGLDLMTDSRSGELSCLLLSYEDKLINHGETKILKLSDFPDAAVTLSYSDVADRSGQILKIKEAEEATLPRAFALHQNHPNPFNPTTKISFDLDHPGRVTLKIFNILGQEVMTLTDREFPAGAHEITWDGVDNNGNPVASGIYLYRIKAGSSSASRKMVLLK